MWIVGVIAWCALVYGAGRWFGRRHPQPDALQELANALTESGQFILLCERMGGQQDYIGEEYEQPGAQT